MKTFSLKPTDAKPEWVLIDAKGQTLGRLSTVIAQYLMGKHRPNYTPHTLSGDYVVVINAKKIKVTGQKLTDKIYYRHSGYPGGLKETSLSQQLEKDPTYVITHAVRGMLPKNKLAAQMLIRLKVYAGSDHKHEAQNPQAVKVGN